MTRDDRAERDRWERLEELWQAVERLPETERQSFIDAVVADDDALRRELQSLLSNADHAHSFFGRFAQVVDDVANEAAQETDALRGQTVGPYRIEARLGEGGMGVVYRALDTRLQRAVALKFLPPELNKDRTAKERFLIEARAAAGLDHPNICTVHEVGEADGRSFIAMAFYPGETLKQTLNRGPVPWRLALEYTTQIARGLAAAHERRIVHRDVKPANVMVSADGMVKLLDFGIARMPDATATRPGHTPGTLAYMSPEQVSSSPVDQRSDLWSLGVLLHELCTGVRPFRGETDAGLLNSILSEQPVPPSALQPDIPLAVDRIVDRLLQKDPAARYAHASDLLDDLLRASPLPVVAMGSSKSWPRRRLVAALGVATGLLVVGVTAAWLISSQQAVPERVLVSDVNFPEDTALADLVAERVQRGLGRSRLLTVVGSSSASVKNALRRTGRDVNARVAGDLARDVAIREGIKVLVRIDLHRSGDGYLLRAALLTSESGDLVDGDEAIAADRTALLAAADHLSQVMGQRIDASLAAVDAGQPLWAFTTDSTESLRKHMAGLTASFNGDDMRSLDLFHESVAIDPKFAFGHLLLGLKLIDAGERVRGQAELVKAYQLRKGVTARERYAIEANYFVDVEGNLAKAIPTFQNQVEQPRRKGEGAFYRKYGDALIRAGDLAQAETIIREGLERVPFQAQPHPHRTRLVTVVYALGRSAEASELLEDTEKRWPDHPVPGVQRAHMLSVSGNYVEAHEHVRRVHHGPGVQWALRAEATFDAASGRLAEAREHLHDLRVQQLNYGLDASALELAITMGKLRLVAGDAEAAVREVETLLQRSPLDSLEAERRPYLPLALFYAQAGRPQRARELLADYQRRVPTEYRKADAWMVHRTRAALLLAADSPAAALAELREAGTVDRIWEEMFDDPLIRMQARPELARTFEKLGMPDSAIAVYERYLDTKSLYRAEMDAFYLAHTLQRLGALYEQRKRSAVAACYYTWLANLWREADPELRPLADAARQRLATLRSNSRGRLRWSESPVDVQARRCAGQHEPQK